MDKDQFLGLFRDFLKLLGSALVANGVITTPNWTTWSGVAIMLAPLAWSFYERTKARRIAKVDALPEAAGVIMKDTPEGKAMAAAIPSPTVVTAGTQGATEVAKV